MIGKSEGKRPGWPTIVLFALVGGSLIACFASLTHPIRFVFLPLGDVGGGFRSYAGRLEWIEYAPWMHDSDWPMWSVPWWLLLTIEAVALLTLVVIKGSFFRAWHRGQSGKHTA